MTQHAFYFNGRRCTGCKTCQLACADYHNLSEGDWYRKIYEFGNGSWRKNEDGSWSTDAFVYHVSVGCQHCENPACMKVCPTGAMHKDTDTGLVLVDDTKCIGCGYCAMACPYGAPAVDREAGHSVKCDGCKDRVAEGKKPICVEACPLRALDFGTADDMATRGERADVAPLPSASRTNPNLFMTPSPDSVPAGAEKGMVSNRSEVI